MKKTAPSQESDNVVLLIKKLTTENLQVNLEPKIELSGKGFFRLKTSNLYLTRLTRRTGYVSNQITSTVMTNEDPTNLLDFLLLLSCLDGVKHR